MGTSSKLLLLPLPTIMDGFLHTVGPHCVWLTMRTCDEGSTGLLESLTTGIVGRSFM